MFVFHNQLEAINDIVRSGEIGDVRLYRITFGFPRRDARDFLYNKALGGGALLDAGGYTMMLPKEERFTSTKKELLERITGLMGGRVAEEMMFNEVTTGAHNDFEQATKIARAMVTEYGMSSLGPVQLEQQEGSVFLGRDYNKSRNFSGQVAFEIDQEMRKIMDDCYKKAQKILKENRDLLDLIANVLLEKETITKEEIDHLVLYGKLPEDGEEEEAKDLNLSDLSLTELKDLAKNKGIKGYSKMSKEELIDELED